MQNYPSPSEPDNSNQPKLVQFPENTPVPTPQVADQLGVSVFPSHVENGSQFVGQSVQSPEALKPEYPSVQASESSQTVYSQQPASVLSSQDYSGLTPQSLAKNQLSESAAIQASVNIPAQQPSIVTVSPIDGSTRAVRPKSIRNWVILVIFIILIGVVFGYFYLTTNKALDGAVTAANNFDPGNKRTYSGMMVSSGQMAYQVYVPNGSDIVIDPQGDMIVFHKLGEGDDEPLKQGYVDGVGGGDRPSLSIWTQKKSNTVSVEGVELTNPFYVDGIQAKYYHRTYQPDDPIGSGKAEGGEKVYRYVFDYDGKQTVVDYFIKRKDDDKSEQVAKMVSSLKFKRSQVVEAPKSTVQD